MAQITNESLYGITFHKASDYRLKVAIDGVSLDNLEPQFRVQVGGAEFNFDRYAEIVGQEIFVYVPVKFVRRMVAGQGRYQISIGNGDSSDVVLYGNAKVIA